MTRLDDYGSEMTTPQQIDDATAEAMLTGRFEGDGDPLAWALRAYREAARTPLPAPSAELAALMAAGAPATPGRHRRAEGARTGGGVAAVNRRWRRIRMAVVTGLAAAAAKLAGLSTAAKAGAGLTIALASVTTAGVTGVLPGPAQEQFDTVVESVTDDRTPPPAEENSEFGERVSEDAKDGGVDGEEISEEARRQGEERRPDLPAPVPDQVPGPPSAPPGGAPTDLPGQRPDPAPPVPPRP